MHVDANDAELIRRLVKAVRLSDYCQRHWYDWLKWDKNMSVSKQKTMQEEFAANHTKMLKARKCAVETAHKLRSF